MILGCSFGFGASSGGGSGSITGSGTPPKVPKFTAANIIADSQISDNGTTVFIGSSATSTKAMFEVNSTSLGVLFPRMTTVQRDAIVVGAAENSLFIFNTNISQYQYYNHSTTSWETIDNGLDGIYSGSGTVPTNTVATLTDSFTFSNGQVNIIGSGATSATTSFLVQNSGASEMFSVRDDGRVSSRDGYWQGALKILYINPNTTTGNLFVGESSGNTTMTGVSNTSIGYNSLLTNTTGNNNIAVGYQSLYANTIGNANISIGYQSLYNNTSGVSNIAIGHQSLYTNNTGGQNTILGYQSASSNTIGSGNVVVGYQAMGFNTSGNNNTVIGREALYNNITGISNVAIGLQAGYYETGSNKLFIDNTARADEADGRAKALIYGIFDAAVANQRLTINGSVGIGLTSPTAFLHIKAGTATASTAPLKFTTGTLNTTAETGAMEFASDFFYLTANAVRTAISTFGRTVVNTASYTVLITDRTIGVTYTTTGACTINLPSAALYPNGYEITVKDEGFNATTNNITIDASTTQTIDGNLTAIINTDKDSLTIYSNGVDAWFIK